MEKDLNWAVLGTGVIANEMAQALQKMGKVHYIEQQGADEIISLADEKQLIVAEAMTIWHMPLYKKLWEIIRNGDLGKVQMITINFGSFKEYNMENRFFNMNLAGGAMLDIGVYALSIVRSFMDKKPEEIDCGCTADALQYELTDMEQAVSRQNADDMKFAFSKDVMDIMTEIRKDWNMKYPGEDW